MDTIDAVDAVDKAGMADRADEVDEVGEADVVPGERRLASGFNVETEGSGVIIMAKMTRILQIEESSEMWTWMCTIPNEPLEIMYSRCKWNDMNRQNRWFCGIRYS